MILTWRKCRRVSITDFRGKTIIDTFVAPTQPVTDYRNAQTGLQPLHFAHAPPFNVVQRQVVAAISRKIIVGYCLWKFLSVLGITHPAIDTRDVALFLPLRRTLRCRTTVSLSVLVYRFMGREIGLGVEHPLEDVRAALDLFRSCKDNWENLVATGMWPCTLPPSSHADYFC
ncbi:hypothetical protein PLICRDRAFT_101349 [Plicaturopsis crispa FD-325 SS-3]|nr:hypothetical protein PLICRDRAFT_101349 [Plicaturopsis crispa FD-325 SS-3]